MAPWLTFFRERVPLVAIVAISAGISLSGNVISGKAFYRLTTLLSFFGLTLFFIVLRMIGEVNDLPKDKVAHPQRPLPRGLLLQAEVGRFSNALLIVMFAFSLLLWVLLNEVAALSYVLVTLYLWLLSCEFGVGAWLARHPFTYGLLRHCVVFLLAFFVVTAASPAAIMLPMMPLSFGLMLFGSFFTYEICRKLDPHAHPILGTYIHYYGFRLTFEFALAMVALSAMGAFALDVASLLFPCELVVVGALGALFFQPALFRIPEVIATLSLLLHTWAVALFYLF